MPKAGTLRSNTATRTVRSAPRTRGRFSQPTSSRNRRDCRDPHDPCRKGGDPVEFGIVASLNRPGGNVTGFTLVGPEIVAKRLELSLQLVPTAAVIGVLANPNNPISKRQLAELETAVGTLGRRIQVVNASTESDFETASAAIDRDHINALIVAADPFFDDR